MVVLKNLHQELSRFRMRVLAAVAFVLFCFGLLEKFDIKRIAALAMTPARPDAPSSLAGPER